MVCVKATCKVAIRTSQRQVVALTIISVYQVTSMQSSILHVNFVSLDVPNRITCHLHFVLSFQRRIIMCNAEACYQEQIIEKFVWNSGNEQVFTSLMCTNETCAMLDRAVDLID